jgi:hypothetical protein
MTRFGRRKARKATVAYIRRLLAAHLTHHGRPRWRKPRGPKALCLACEPCHRSDSRMMVSARAAVAPAVKPLAGAIVGRRLTSGEETSHACHTVSPRFSHQRVRGTSTPNQIIAEGTDWSFLNELKRELKA